MAQQAISDGSTRTEHLPATYVYQREVLIILERQGQRCRRGPLSREELEIVNMCCSLNRPAANCVSLLMRLGREILPAQAVASQLRPYISTAAKQFAPGNFVTEGTTNKVGVTLAVEDPAEANPRVQVRWVLDLTVEWVRTEYLYRAFSAERIAS